MAKAKYITMNWDDLSQRNVQQIGEYIERVAQEDLAHRVFPDIRIRDAGGQINVSMTIEASLNRLYRDIKNSVEISRETWDRYVLNYVVNRETREERHVYLSEASLDITLSIAQHITALKIEVPYLWRGDTENRRAIINIALQYAVDILTA